MIMLLNAKDILYICTILILMDISIKLKIAKRPNNIHCNWGWNGLHNGYFLSTALNAEENPAYDDGIVSTRSSNFRYKLKTATFIK